MNPEEIFAVAIDDISKAENLLLNMPFTDISLQLLTIELESVKNKIKAYSQHFEKL